MIYTGWYTNEVLLLLAVLPSTDSRMNNNTDDLLTCLLKIRHILLDQHGISDTEVDSCVFFDSILACGMAQSHHRVGNNAAALIASCKCRVQNSQISLKMTKRNQ